MRQIIFKYWFKHHKIIVYGNLPLQKHNKLSEIKYFVPGAKNDDLASNFDIEDIIVEDSDTSLEFLSSDNELLVQVSQQYDKEIAVKKRKVPAPFRSLSPVFSSSEDELLIQESQKHVQELEAKKRIDQQYTKTSATGIVPGHGHVYGSALNCGSNKIYNPGFNPVLSMEFGHPQNTSLNYLLCNGLNHLPNTGFGHVQNSGVDHFWPNSFNPVPSNGLVPIYNPNFNSVFNIASSSFAYSNLISNSGFRSLIPGELNNPAYFNTSATVRDLDNQNPYSLNNNPLFLYQNTVAAPLFQTPTTDVLRESLLNEINQPAELILASGNSKRPSSTITSSVPSKQKKNSVTEDLEVEVIFSKSANKNENQPSKSTDVPLKTKQQILPFQIHSEEKSKSAQQEDFTQSLMGGNSGKNFPPIQEQVIFLNS